MKVVGFSFAIFSFIFYLIVIVLGGREITLHLAHTVRNTLCLLAGPTLIKSDFFFCHDYHKVFDNAMA